MASLADAFASIESSGNPYAWNTLPGGRRSRYRGLFQFGPEQERRYGITDWTDPAQQRSAFERHIGDLRGDLSRRLGRAPADWELYFGHQQGPAGSAALLTAAPGTSAWDAIRPFYGSDAMAHQAITGNIPRGHALYGRDSDEIGADEFARMWQARYGRAPGAPLGAPVVPVATAGDQPQLAAEGASPSSASWLQNIGSLLGGFVGSAEAQTPPLTMPQPVTMPPGQAGLMAGLGSLASRIPTAPITAPTPTPTATPTPMPAAGAPPFTPRPDPRGLGVLGLPRMTPMPPSATVPPFGAPTVTPAPPTSELDTLGYGPSEIQPPGRDITREMVEAGLPSTPPPPVDADAIVRGAEAAAADRAAQPAQPGYFERLMSNPAFLAGLSILGTAPGGNWGPNAAQAASQAIRGGREAEEWRRLQARRATQDRIWREAFGTNGQPNAGHPLLTGMPPGMAATIYAMGAEEGLPAAQRWQMFRGQQQYQMDARQRLIDSVEGTQPSPDAQPRPSEFDVTPSGGQAIQPPADSGIGVAQAVPRGLAGGPSATPRQGGSTVSFGNRVMSIPEARRLAFRLDAMGQRSEVLEDAIKAADRENQAPSGFRYAPGGQSLEAIPGGPAEQIAADVAGRLAMLQTAQGQMPAIMDFFTRSWGPGETGRAIIGGPMFAQEYDRARRVVQIAIEGALRSTTGAAAPVEEVANYMNLFMPRVNDSRQTAEQKLALLNTFMNNVQSVIMRGRGGAQTPASTPSIPPVATRPSTATSRPGSRITIERVE